MPRRVVVITPSDMESRQEPSPLFAALAPGLGSRKGPIMIAASPARWAFFSLVSAALSHPLFVLASTALDALLSRFAQPPLAAVPAYVGPPALSFVAGRATFRASLLLQSLFLTERASALVALASFSLSYPLFALLGTAADSLFSLLARESSPSSLPLRIALGFLLACAVLWLVAAACLALLTLPYYLFPDATLALLNSPITGVLSSVAVLSLSYPLFALVATAVDALFSRLALSSVPQLALRFSMFVVRISSGCATLWFLFAVSLSLAALTMLPTEKIVLQASPLARVICSSVTLILSYPAFALVGAAVDAVVNAIAHSPLPPGVQQSALLVLYFLVITMPFKKEFALAVGSSPAGLASYSVLALALSYPMFELLGFVFDACLSSPRISSFHALGVHSPQLTLFFVALATAQPDKESCRPPVSDRARSDRALSSIQSPAMLAMSAVPLSILSYPLFSLVGAVADAVFSQLAFSSLADHAAQATALVQHAVAVCIVLWVLFAVFLLFASLSILLDDQATSKLAPSHLALSCVLALALSYPLFVLASTALDSFFSQLAFSSLSALVVCSTTVAFRSIAVCAVLWLQFAAFLTLTTAFTLLSESITLRKSPATLILCSVLSFALSYPAFAFIGTAVDASFATLALSSLATVAQRGAELSLFSFVICGALWCVTATLVVLPLSLLALRYCLSLSLLRALLSIVVVGLMKAIALRGRLLASASFPYVVGALVRPSVLLRCTCYSCRLTTSFFIIPTSLTRFFTRRAVAVLCSLLLDPQ